MILAAIKVEEDGNKKLDSFGQRGCFDLLTLEGTWKLRACPPPATANTDDETIFLNVENFNVGKFGKIKC